MEEYNPECVSKCMPVDIEMILEKMGYDIQQKKLTDNGSIRAIIYFNFDENKAEIATTKQGHIYYDMLSFSQYENFSEKYESLVKTYEKKKAEPDDIKQKTDDIKRRHTSALRFLSDIESLKEPLQEFDEEIFHRLVDYIEIKGRDEIRFVWKFPV